MAFIRRLRNQNWLFPPSIADLIEEDHICRLVEEVVEGIDLKRIEKRYDGPGSPAYHPKVMIQTACNPIFVRSAGSGRII